MKTRVPSIIADGRRRFRNSPLYLAARDRVALEVRTKYQNKLIHASIFQRLWLEFKITLEVRRRLEREFPASALHCARAIF